MPGFFTCAYSILSLVALLKVFDSGHSEAANEMLRSCCEVLFCLTLLSRCGCLLLNVGVWFNWWKEMRRGYLLGEVKWMRRGFQK